jgi:hypothetical protein
MRLLVPVHTDAKLSSRVGHPRHVRPAEVRVFTDHDYHGRSGEVRRDVGDLHGMWRDSIESIRFW